VAPPRAVYIIWVTYEGIGWPDVSQVKPKTDVFDVIERFYDTLAPLDAGVSQRAPRWLREWEATG
jgi:hypothetical protein